MAKLEVIQRRFFDARKIHGHKDEITVPSGQKVRGYYLLVESGVVTPSHDPLNGFIKSGGFPTDKNGSTVNDRDYERDTDAQEITRTIAANYDSRALQTPVCVSKDGIVLSGNGRTMAGMLAARDDTDGAYISYLVMFPDKYGFTPQDVSSFEHPRVVFRVLDRFPYNAETFAMFNAQEMKSQSKTEQAVKLGKLVDDATFNRIIRNINRFDTMGEFYNDYRAATEAINDLRTAGVISQMQYPEMFDGDSISAQAREILENVLIGKAFNSNPDSVRQITAFKGVRKNIITALSEISSNIVLEDYSLESEMAQAIELCYQARANGGMNHGDAVSMFARQTTLFGENATVVDYRNVTVLMLADMLNHIQTSRLKKVYAIYNHQAHQSASGQTDMFCTDGVKTKDEILNDVYKILNNGTKQELNIQIKEATSQRKQDAITAVQEDGDSRASNQRLNADGTANPSLQEEPEIEVGKICGLRIASGEVIAVHLKRLSGHTAGIFAKGWNNYKVPSSLIVPHRAAKPNFPEWLKEGTLLSNGMTIEDVGRTYTRLSDGNLYQHIIILLHCAPAKEQHQIDAA